MVISPMRSCVVGLLWQTTTCFSDYEHSFYFDTVLTHDNGTFMCVQTCLMRQRAIVSSSPPPPPELVNSEVWINIDPFFSHWLSYSFRASCESHSSPYGMVLDVHLCICMCCISSSHRDHLSSTHTHRRQLLTPLFPLKPVKSRAKAALKFAWMICMACYND